MIIASCASKCIFALVQVPLNLPSRTKLPSSTTAQYCIWADPLVWMGMFVIAFEMILAQLGSDRIEAKFGLSILVL